jgi:hypothetical protein
MYIILLVALGYLSGYALSYIAEEELHQGKKYLLFFVRFLFLILVFYLFNQVSIILGLFFLAILNKKHELFFISFSSGLLLGLNNFPFIASLCFLLGMPIASLEKKWYFALLFFILGTLPGMFF